MADYSMQLHLVEDIQQKFTQIGQQLSSIGETLSSAIAKHLAEFEGDTKTAFEQVQTRYQSEHTTMVTDLNSAEQGLAQIHQEIVAGEAKGAAMWAM